jgi:DNA-binding NarL/FixJ family response regulator
MKREASDKVLEAIRVVLEGCVYVSGSVGRSIVDKIAGESESRTNSRWGKLSDREMDVFLLIGKGYGTQQIAKRLTISVKTVETHRANIKIKLQLNSGEELLQQAIGWAQEFG